MKLHMNILVATAITLALALFAGACGTSNPTAQSTPRPVVTVTVAAGPAASAVVTATLPVRVLHSELGIPGQGPSYPTKIKVRIPGKWVGEVGAYGVAGVVLLAPSGWTASDALIAADGSSGATLHSRSLGSPGIHGRLEFEQTSACVGCSWDDAGQYFPWVRNHWSQTGYASSPVPLERPGLSEHSIGPRLIAYSVHSGAEVDLGFKVDGVAHTWLKLGGSQGAWGPLFDRLEVALPPEDRGLATVILNYYLAYATARRFH